MNPSERAHQRERLVLRATPGIAAQSYLDAPTTQLKPPTAELPVQRPPSFGLGGLLLLLALAFVVTTLVLAGVAPLAILLGVFG